MPIIYRVAKGSPLTWAEGDGNWKFLDDGKVDKVTGWGLSQANFTAAEKTKLAGIAAGATANSSDATLLNRANHTGQQLAATISNFAAAALSVLLTGLSVATGTAVIATDSILVAIGKLQAQFNALGTASLLTATTSTTDTTTGRAVRIGDHGTGSQVSPFISDMDAPTANGYSWVTSGTANQIIGWASGSQVLTFFASAAEVAQMFFSRTVPMRVGIRRKTTNVWQTMAELITSATMILDPALGTGGVVFAGSNGNGYFTKYADGTLICWQHRTGTQVTTSTVVGSGFQSSSGVAYTFPVAFVAGSDVQVIPRATYISGGSQPWAIATGQTLTGFSAFAMAFHNNVVATCGYIAIGRWK